MTTVFDTPQQEYIAKSKYARFFPKEGRREDWKETVARYFAFAQEHIAEKFPQAHEAWGEAAAVLWESVHDLKVMPSMRLLMTAGEAVKRNHISAYNCFGPDVSYMTQEGNKTFAQTVGTVQKVLARDGQWREAKVRSFGVQATQNVHFRPGNTSRTGLRHVVNVTPDHRWITTNRGEVTDLRVGDTVAFNAPEEPDFNAAEFIRGFGFGDGTITCRGTAQIRLCGAKAKHLPVFDGYGHCSVSYPPSSNGDPTVHFHQGHFEDWKEVPANPSYWWLAGYQAADGTKNQQVECVDTQDDQAAQYLLENSAYGAKAVTGHFAVSNQITNFGQRSAPLQRVSLRDTVEFSVVAIEEAETQEVFCVTEPVTGTFTLMGGILTGNCHYAAIDKIRKFSDMLLILMHGTGSGFTADVKNSHKLPTIADDMEYADMTIVVADSKEGWAKAFHTLLVNLYAGSVPAIDYSKIRPKGARLKTFGGRASGPEPLKKLFDYCIKVFRHAAGRKLSPLEVHDISCMIADIVVVGGVRRSALISLSDLNDKLMANAKGNFNVDQYSLIREDDESVTYSITMKRNQPTQPTYTLKFLKGKEDFQISQLETKKIVPWYKVEPQRALANNSVSYEDRPPVNVFLKEWAALIESYSGERGFFNKKAAKLQAEKWGRRKYDGDYGCNPCSEILLRSNQMCNLTEAVLLATDDLETFLLKIEQATVMGMFQATLTDFKGVDPELKKNCEEERLLGVSLTGVMDHPVLNWVNDEAIRWLELGRDRARAVAEKWAGILNINVPTAITCVKPSGTVAQLVNAGTGGMHPRFGQYYIRRYRQDNKDPITDFLKIQGVHNEPCINKPEDQTIFSFVVASPEGAVMRDHYTAIEQLEHWLMFQRHWCEHKPSITVYVRDEEWMEVGNWVFKNFDEVSGVSFLPYDNGSYQQAPFEEITKEAYDQFVATYPQVLDWSQFHESTDRTSGGQELACTGNTCGI